MRSAMTAALVLGALAALVGRERVQAAPGLDGGPRQVESLNPGWQYAPVDNGVTGAWQEVNLPHSWNAQDTLDGDHKYRMGVGLYRKEILLDPRPDRRYFLRFEGANIKSWVSINGKPAGEHRGGYTAFAYEITGLVAPGKNLIEVKVDNSFDREIMPLYCDYNFYGGIYRNVWLIATGKSAIAVTDHASSGVYLTPREVSPEKADLEFLARLSAPEAAVLAVRFTVLDATGAEVKTVEAAPVPAGDWLEARAALTLDSPRLWNGVADPYLYRVRAELLSGGQVVDAVEQPLGLRYYRVDAERGFFLNGRSYRLHGVNRHQDREGKANAIGAEDQEQDFALMREMGVNAVRLAHYPQADLAYSICDRSGIAVWAELPFIGRMGDSTGIFLDSPKFRDNLKLQLVELIRQNYNHPSIVVWGLFNELSPPGDPTPLLRELNALAHQEDPHRLTTVATMMEGTMDDVTDLTCWNQYWGWYYGLADSFAAWADAQHRGHPQRRLCMSEYGAGASIVQHSELNYNVYTQGHWHPENYQAYVHEKLFAAMAERKYFWATFLWNMFDFGVVKRDEGDRPNINDKGMVTFDRQVKKDVFFFYKANWNPEPMIYITNRRFTERRSPLIEVKVYCNAGPVALTVNGIEVKMEPRGNSVYTARALLRPGKNEVTATAAAADGRALSDHCVWKFLAP
jgi:beta-galactosidase